MAAFRFQVRRARMRWRGIILFCVAALAATVFVAGSSALVSPSGFEGGDGDLTCCNALPTAGTSDWANAPNLVSSVEQASGSTDNSFGQGTKEDNAAVTVVQGSIPPNKSDLTRFYVSNELVGTQNFLYLAWERSNVLGSANMDFELNQKATANLTGTFTGPITINRTPGDLLVTYDFTNGGAKPVLGLLTWLTAANGTTAQCFSSSSLPCWGKHIDLTSANSDGAINTAAVTDPINPGAPRSLAANTFGEAEINLTASGIFTPGSCEAFASSYLKSRSSTSFSAEVKDFVAPQPVNVTNCATITIHKVTENSNASFPYTTTGALTPATFSLSGGGQQQYLAVQPGNYSVTESAPTGGWVFKDLTCSATGQTSASPSSRTASITVSGAGSVDCTYTNHLSLSPTIATVLSKSTANVGDTVNDTSTLSGATPNAGGTVTYSVYGNSSCTGTAQDAGTKTVTSGSVPNSNGIQFNSAGTFYWQAVYSGDVNNNGATSLCTSEVLTVNKNGPTIATLLSKSTANIGDTVNDTSTLSGATTNAGGTVSYSVFNNANCTGTPVDAGTKTVTNGSVPNSNGITFNSAGTFYWQAVYSGDVNNNGATSTCISEQLVVAKNSPTIATLLSKSTANIGDTVNDTSTLSGATTNAGGTVTYSVYGNSSCTGSAQDAGTKTVTNGSVPNSNGIQFNAAGTYYWQASYSGDVNNNPALSPCLSEQLVVNQNSPTIATLLSKSTANIGDTVNDTSTLSGATTNAGGTVTYSVYGNSSCTGSAQDAGTKTVTNGSVPNSNGIQFNAAGTYYWQASYSGDVNNKAALSPCTSEQLIVKTNPSIMTSLPAAIVNIGDKIHDTSVLSGNTGDAGGNVTYSVYSDSTCSTQVKSLGTKTVTNGAVPDSDETSFSTPGRYYFQAVYSGDPKNNGATSPCTDEVLLVKTNPSIGTTLSATSVSIGAPVHDSSTLTGVTSDAIGTVTYSVFDNANCSGTPVDAGTKAVTNGAVLDSNAVTFSAAGTYYWQAVYSGDTKNNGATSVCTSEVLVVNPNHPTFGTAQNLLPNDSATISGATGGAGGSFTFSLYSPSDSGCSGTSAYTQVVGVSGSGTYNTTNATFLATSPGTWRWKVIYSGDANNVGSTSACGVENFTITNG